VTVAETVDAAAPTSPRRRPSNKLLLGLVCAVHAVAPLLLIGPHFWYEWDETVYISQVSRQAPAGLFTAPRARGLPMLLAPVTELTTSTVALRIYLTLLSSVLMYAAFRPWLRLRPGLAVPLAAGLFTTLWTALYYGFEAMPNFYVAVGAVAAVACCLLAVRTPTARRYLWLLAGWVAFVGLMRPSDAVYLAVPLVVIVLLHRAVPGRERLVVVSALVGGLALGCSEWVVEAYTSYGGLMQRLHSASAENDSGIHMSLLLEARAAGGPTLCRPCTRALSPPTFAWWFAVPPLAALGIYAAHKRRQMWLAWTPTIVALALLLQYIVTIDYAAQRFLLPTYALLSLPVVDGCIALYDALRRRWTPRAAAASLAVVLVAHVVIQLGVLERGVVAKETRSRLQYLSVAAALHRLGVTAPCVVVGYYAAPIAFADGCTDVPTISHRTAVQAIARRGAETVVVLTTSPAPAHDFYADWRHQQLQGRHLAHAWFAHVHPMAR